MKFEEIREKLPSLNCSECGYSLCDEFAKAVAERKANLKDCVVLIAGRKVVLEVNGKDVPMGEFVQKIVKNTVLGMVKSLKKTDLKAGDTVKLKIVVDRDDL